MLEKLELFGISARQSIIFHPLALVFNSRITDGVCFEVVRPGKRADVLAAGGRYVGGTIGANFDLTEERQIRQASQRIPHPR